LEKLTEQFKQWSYLETLSPELHGFCLTVEHRQAGEQYHLFSYYNQILDKFFLVLYDKATKEYIARWRIGLIEFCDVNFIAPDLSTLEKLLQTRMESALHCMAVFNPAALGSVFLGKKILEWSYTEKLAASIHGFSLVINPKQPLKGINGSYIIIDYSDFLARTNLLIYYNIYRDVFYGEIIFRDTPQMTTLFDAATLPELEEQIKTNLDAALAHLRQRVLAAKEGRR
jgi:hypothetical protein